MGSLYEKQNKLWARYKDEAGKWSNMPTPYRPGDEPKARRFLVQLEARVGATRDASAAGAGDPSAALTVEMYAWKWLQARRLWAPHRIVTMRLGSPCTCCPGSGACCWRRFVPVTSATWCSRFAGGQARSADHSSRLSPDRGMFRDGGGRRADRGDPVRASGRGVLPKKTTRIRLARHGHLHARGSRGAHLRLRILGGPARALRAQGAGGAPARRGRRSALAAVRRDTRAARRALAGATKTQVPRRVPVHPTLRGSSPSGRSPAGSASTAGHRAR